MCDGLGSGCELRYNMVKMDYSSLGIRIRRVFVDQVSDVSQLSRVHEVGPVAGLPM